MKKLASERGELNILLIPVILLSMLFIAAASFGVWAFMGRQDYKENSDARVAAAVVVNTKDVQAKDAKDYAEAAKQPLKYYTGPEPYGTLKITYPKTWSGYVITTENGGSSPLDAYFSPDVVPNTAGRDSTFALRVQIVDQAYDTTVNQFATYVRQGKATATPYKLPKVPSVVGERIEGQIAQNKQGSLIVLPIRDKTLKMWIESTSYKADLENNVLPNTTFSP